MPGMSSAHSRTIFSRFRTMRWAAVVMLLVVLLQNVGVAACFDHDLKSSTATSAVVAGEAADPAKATLHSGTACCHCVCPHFVALPSLSPSLLPSVVPGGAVANDPQLHSSAPIEESLRPPAAV
jgi:hypothetical protein